MRYFILILLILPIILLALTNLLTKYKLHRITKERFRTQVTIWSIILVVLVASFPVYNILLGNPPFASAELSLFDIVQTTVLVVFFYIINNQRQKIDLAERRLRDLHQEISIILSTKK